MKKDIKHTVTDRPQKGKEVKKNLPVKNKMTDNTKNIASQTPGLNQDKITTDDLLPSDGDNLTG
ncbi:MAG: hypothetical protein QM791_06705 [Ferruginibacter sp.]